MNGLASLVDYLERSHLRGGVNQLALVAHGDEAGVVQLDRNLTARNSSEFEADFGKLKDYLTFDAWVTFYSCIAGKEQRGTDLLVSVSRLLAGRTIVGFEMFGLIGPAGSLNSPGTMKATESSLPQIAIMASSQHGLLNPWCPWAKRARDGKLLHIPALEQNGRFNKTCANPGCSGHSSPYHSCPGW